MNDPDHFLARIFSLSRRSREALPSDLPFGLETAVLAHWRSSSRAQAGEGMLRGLRWASCFACAIALFVAALQRDEITQFSRTTDLQTRVADSAIATVYGYE